jgi:hypothetical protein
MNDRHARRLIPRLEAMEDRVALSATALAIRDVPAAHVRHPPRNPIVVDLNPQSTGIQITDAAIDTRAGVIRIQGVVTYPPLSLPPDFPPAFPLTTAVSLAVTQAANRLRSVSGSVTSSPINYVEAGFSTRFALYVTAGSGYFVPGKATVALSSFVPFFFSPSQANPSASAVVRLREVRF